MKLHEQLKTYAKYGSIAALGFWGLYQLAQNTFFPVETIHDPQIKLGRVCKIEDYTITPIARLDKIVGTVNVENTAVISKNIFGEYHTILLTANPDSVKVVSGSEYYGRGLLNKPLKYEN